MAGSAPRSALLVAPQAPPAVGGVERHVSELARELAGRGVAVTLAVCDPTGALPRQASVDGIRIVRFATVGGDNGFHVSPSLAHWAWRHARDFDVVHGHSYHAPVALAAFIAARRARRPFVLTPHFHGTGHSPLRRALHLPYRPFGHAMVRGAEAVVCVSRAEAALVRREIGPDLPITVIPNGVDVDAIRAATPYPRTDGRRVVLSVGRLEAYKRVELLVDAMADLRGSHRLVVVGDGPQRQALVARARSLDLAWAVELVGALERPAVLRWLRTADVLVTLSAHEAFGLVALEAAVAGAAVIASAIPAHDELATDLEGRITVVQTDAGPGVIAGAVAGAVRHEPTAAELARIPSWSDVANRTLDVYARAVAARRGRTIRRPEAA